MSGLARSEQLRKEIKRKHEMLQRIGEVTSKRIDLRLCGRRTAKRRISVMELTVAGAISSAPTSARMSYERTYVSCERARAASNLHSINLKSINGNSHPRESNVLFFFFFLSFFFFYE